MDDDPALVTAALAGNRDAFASLYDRYAGLVRALCFEATGTVVDAQDLAQEVFLHAYKRLADLRSHEQFGSWVAGMARLSGKQWRRSRHRDRHDFVGSPPELEPASAPFGSSDRFEELHQALLELSETERLAVHLFYQRGEPAKEGSRMLKLSLAGFYRVLERAREKLRVRLCHDENKEIRK